MTIYTGKILVADSDLIVCKTLKDLLLDSNYNVLFATNGKEALDIFEKQHLNLVIIDNMLSNIDGYEVCRKIRKVSSLPIIMLSAVASIQERLIGLEIGVDEYLLKPFFFKELEARIKSILHLCKKTSESSILVIGDLAIDTINKTLSKGKEKISLSKIEFAILELLIAKAGEKVSRDSILFNVWGYFSERQGDTRLVDVHISRLRAKLETDPRNPDFVLTQRGAGYMFRNFKPTKQKTLENPF